MSWPGNGRWLNNVNIIHSISSTYILRTKGWLVREIEFLSSHVIRVTSFVQEACPSSLSWLPGRNPKTVFITVLWNKHGEAHCWVQRKWSSLGVWVRLRVCTFVYIFLSNKHIHPHLWRHAETYLHLIYCVERKPESWRGYNLRIKIWINIKEKECRIPTQTIKIEWVTFILF